MAHLARRLMVLLPLLASTGALAMSIGEIDVISRLGEPLQAKVPISLDDDVLPGADCVRIVGPARNHPDLARAQVDLVSLSGRHYITIRTTAPVSDPVLDLTLRAEGCGPSMQKDFVILLSPKDIGTFAAAPVAKPRPPSVSHSEPAKQVSGRATAPATRLGTSQFTLKLDYDDTAFGQLAERIAQRRQAAYRAAANRRAQAGRVGANVSPDAQSLLAKVEPAPTKPAQTVGDNQAARPQSVAPAARPTTATTAAPTDRLVLQAPPEDFLPMPDGATTDATVPVAGTGEPTGTDTAPGAATGDKGMAAGLDAPAAAPADAAPWYAWFLNPYNLLVPLLLILLALGIALWLKLRKPQSRFLDKDASELHSLLPSDPEDPMLHPLMSRNLPPVEEVFVEPPEAKTLLGEALEGRHRSQNVEPLEFATAAVAKPIQSEDFSVEQHDSFDHVMELAEVMLAFGRKGQAIEALSQHIQENPRQSVDPWLKLLDLYQQSNLREEFEVLAADLHKHYNVAIIQWNDFAKEPANGPLTLESLPHIMSRLTENWGTQASLDYLNRLLADNRGGQRLGFSMPIVRDILLLRDILRQTCPVSATSL